MVGFKYTKRFKDSAPMNLLTAIERVNYTLRSLRQDIDDLPIISFDPRYTKPVNLTSVDIVGKALDEYIVVTLDTYTQNWFSYKYAPVLSHVKPINPNCIHYNTRIFKWDMSVHDWTQNLFHELIHIWDAHSPYTFWHDDNNLKGKDETAPVKLAKVLTSVAIGLHETKGEEMLLW